MLGLIRKKKPFIHAHWYVPLLDVRIDTENFYRSIEEELSARKVPGLTVERIDFKEGSVINGKRTYLRLRRERLAVDVCSAPFGTSWWFSARAAELPRLLRGWELLLTLAGLAGFFLLYWYLFGLVTGGIVFGSSLAFLLLVFLTARSWPGLDEFLVHLPVTGALYERFARAETYYRQDQWLMYSDIVNALVRQKVVEFSKAAGVEDPQFVEAKPRQVMSQLELEKYGFAKKKEAAVVILDSGT